MNLRVHMQNMKKSSQIFVLPMCSNYFRLAYYHLAMCRLNPDFKTDTGGIPIIIFKESTHMSKIIENKYLNQISVTT